MKKKALLAVGAGAVLVVAGALVARKVRSVQLHGTGHHRGPRVVEDERETGRWAEERPAA